MNREIVRSTRFKKDFKRFAHDAAFCAQFTEVVRLLVADAPLPPALRDHELVGEWKGMRDCHVRPDVVLIYQKYEEVVSILRLERLGSHSEVF
jgi:mRNA interferase YafQ